MSRVERYHPRHAVTAGSSTIISEDEKLRLLDCNFWWWKFFSSGFQNQPEPQPKKAIFCVTLFCWVGWEPQPFATLFASLRALVCPSKIWVDISQNYVIVIFGSCHFTLIVDCFSKYSIRYAHLHTKSMPGF